MDGKQAYPFAPASVHPRSDEESQSDQELRRKKKLKLYAYIAAFAVFQTIIILVFALIVMRIKTPDVKIRSVTVQNLNVGTASYNMTLIAEVTVRNKNFGDYKYDNSTMSINYGTAADVIIGDGLIPKGNAKAKKTRRVNVTMEVSSNGVSDPSQVTSDINSGILMFNSHATLRGKVHLMKIMKKRKTTEMNCTMALNLTSRAIQDLNCQ
uniref:Late embryogenesis abundant protein LEA-2 subgroup domain-containing protein n=1 Tax=Davidia involucrata TaxID=16924 RepID=A0A5B6ZV42_DAVIN